MLMKATVTFPGCAPETISFNAVILLAQDEQHSYLLMRGPRNVLQTLMVWGAEHWWSFLPPGEEYMAAVQEIVFPQIRKHDDRWMEIIRPEAGSGQCAVGSGQICLELTGAYGDMKLTGLTDLLLFVLEGSEPRRATGGSGMQKGALVETGIAELFGEDIAEQFRAAKYAGLPGGVRAMVENMRGQMRREPGESLVITPEAAKAIADQGDKEKN